MSLLLRHKHKSTMVSKSKCDGVVFLVSMSLAMSCAISAWTTLASNYERETERLVDLLGGEFLTKIQFKAKAIEIKWSWRWRQGNPVNVSTPIE